MPHPHSETPAHDPNAAQDGDPADQRPDAQADAVGAAEDAEAADLAAAMAGASAALDDAAGEGTDAPTPSPETQAAAAAATNGDAPTDTSTDTSKGAHPDAGTLMMEVADLKDKLLRAMAETENIRRRAERDKAETAKYAVANFARDMLGVADNVRRALDTIKPDDRAASEALENLSVGLEMVERETLTTLDRHGVKPVDAIGKRLDANLHEAMFEYEDPSQPHGTIGQVIEQGYTLHDRLLRPAKVGVTKGGPKPGAPGSASGSAPGPDAAAESASKQASAYEGGAGAQGANLDESL